MPFGKPRSPLFELGRLSSFAGPLALASFAHTLNGAIALAWAGRSDEVTLGAVGVGESIYYTVGVLGVGVLLALEPLLGSAHGRGDGARVKTLIAQGLWLSAALFLLLGLVVAAAAAKLGSIGLASPTVSAARGYLWARVPGLLPWLAFVALRSHAALVGRGQAVLHAALFANAVTLVLLPLAGRSTTSTALAIGGCESVATWASLVWLLVRLGPPVSSGLPRPDVDALRAIVRLGAPAGLTLFLECAAFAALNVAVGALDPRMLGAHQVAITWVGSLFMLPVGLGSAAAVRVGEELGRGDPHAARRAGELGLSLALVFGAAGFGLFLCFPSLLARTLTSDVNVLEVTERFLPLAGCVLFVDSLQAFAAGAVRGAGDTRAAFWSILVGHYFIGLPLGVLLAKGLGFGVRGLWIGLFFGLASVAIALGLRLTRLSTRSAVQKRCQSVFLGSA